MDLLSIKNKVAIVTGSTRGIGHAIALCLATRGAIVYVNGRERVQVEKLTDDLKNKGFNVDGCAGDVSDEKFVKQFIEYVFKKHNRLDIIVNNAGISETRLLEEITTETWNKFLNNNLTSSFLMCRESAKIMKSKQGGKIINISSLAALVGRTGGAHYAASKGGVVAFTKTIAKELGPFNIQVNAIVPGVVNTDMSKLDTKEHQVFYDKLKRDTPLRRITQPEDIANTALFLASPLSDAVTGQIIIVDCGSSLNYFGI